MFTVFDNAFRTQCATAPVGEMLRGTLTHDTIHSSIQLALTTTANAMYAAAFQVPETSAGHLIAAYQLS